MLKSKKLNKCDKIAIVSLSSGILGEDFIKHEVDLGIKRLIEMGLNPVFMPNSQKGILYLKEHPEARAQDLLEAFKDNTIKGIICAIGGESAFRTLPYLLDNKEFINIVKANPKVFLGFSDTTTNHLMFYRLGLQTFYGQAFLPDICEFEDNMLPYSYDKFMQLISGDFKNIKSSPIWYMERTDFSVDAVGTQRTKCSEIMGFDVLRGKGSYTGRLLGGCLESLYDIIVGERYEEESLICSKYEIFPSINEWKEKVLFLETSEEKPIPAKFEKMINVLKDKGIFDVVGAVLFGKPMDETYYDEYKEIILRVVDNKQLLILFNINFGHATPRCILPLGALVCVDSDNKEIRFEEKILYD